MVRRHGHTLEAHAEHRVERGRVQQLGAAVQRHAAPVQHEHAPEVLEREVQVVHGDHDQVLAPARGQRYVLPGGAFFEVRDGRIARVTNYYNLQDWIAQVSR